MVTFLEDLESLPPDSEPLSLRFCNSLSYRGREEPAEDLPNPESLAKWFAARGITVGEPISQNEYERALALREAAYCVISALSDGRNVPPRPMKTLNAEIAQALAGLELDDGMDWRQKTSGFDAALGQIALSTAGVLASPTRERLRICADDECRWVFLDRSKNRSRRWCSMSDCGNLAKARRFRAKHGS